MLMLMLLRLLLLVSWALTCKAYILAVFISLLYWTVLYEGGGLSYINFFVHGSQVGYE